MTATWIQFTNELLSWPMMFLFRLVPSSVLMLVRQEVRMVSCLYDLLLRVRFMPSQTQHVSRVSTLLLLRSCVFSPASQAFCSDQWRASSGMIVGNGLLRA